MIRRAFDALLAAGIALCLAAPALAGGSYSANCPGVSIKYSGAGTITLNFDQGALGSRSKAQADAIVAEAVSVWTNVPTATVTLVRGNDLPVDVTLANYVTYFANYTDGLNPVIYDTDGAIIDNFFGAGAKNNVLGFAGSHFVSCAYTEGKAVISGFLAVSDNTLKLVIAHEVGHMIGLDHTQIDSEQGLSSSNYPLMYPIAYRSQPSLHEDDLAAVSALYPDPIPLGSMYGQLSGTFTQVGGTPILGANLWARENTSNKVYSIVSDYLKQNTGYFKLLLPAGTYTLHAGAIRTTFTGASSVGPYSGSLAGSSFLSPLYVGGTPMTPLTLGNATPVQITISAGCVATASFNFGGAGNVAGNCTNNYTVSFNSNGGSAVINQAVAQNGTATQPTAPTKTGSTFVGWYSDVGLTSPFNFSTAIIGNITLYAKWTHVNMTPIIMLLLD